MNHYLDAYATVDPISHDLIIAYIKENSTQSEDRICVNRITPTGECVWGEGILVADYVGLDYSNVTVDAFEDGSGFSLVYEKSSSSNPYFKTVECLGMDINGNILWSKTLSSTPYRRNFCDISAGFHLGQNIVAWVNAVDGGMYGQNIGPDGTLGPIEPPIVTCYPPEDFEGEYIYDMEAQQFGVKLTWTAPETQPLHYNLYRYDMVNRENIVIEVAGDATEYFDESGLGSYKYQLTAVYEDCESDFALTPAGEDFVIVDVTGIEETSNEAIATVLRIFTMNGQCLKHCNLDELGNGIYLIQGLTEDGQMVTRKMVINH